MTSKIAIEELRELFLSAPESAATRWLGIVISLTLVSVVLWLVSRRKLREELTPIWMGATLAFAIVSVEPRALSALTRAIGAWTLSSTLFFLGEFFLLVICLNYAVRLSKAGDQIRCLAQEVALLRTELDQRCRRDPDLDSASVERPGL